MLRLHLRGIVLLLTVLVIIPYGKGYAEENSTHISLKQAIVKVLEVEPDSEVVKTDISEYQDRMVYKLRLIKEGRVNEMLVDIKNGEIIRP